MKTKIVKKLNAKTIIGGRVDAPSKDNPKVPLFAITGMANAVKVGESQYGEYVAFMGNFAAVKMSPDGTMQNGDEDEQFRAGQLFLPDVAQNLLYGPVSNAAKGENVQFSFVIGVERDEDAATGYVYYAEPLIEADVNDPMEQLTAEAFKQLPAPKGGSKK